MATYWIIVLRILVTEVRAQPTQSVSFPKHREMKFMIIIMNVGL